MTQIHEALGALPAAPVKGSRWRARLIEADRQGSSGYYSREVLERDGATTWPVGTPVYFDHPTESERYDRPERSVRDLAGKIVTVPAMEGDGLYADIDFYSWAAPVVAEMAGDIGMSIRASATVEASKDASIRGPMITSLSEGQSVDLVTKAGAGGKLVALLESARAQEARNVGQWVESRIHRDFTVMADDMAADGRLTRDERIGLSSAIGEALAAFVAHLEANQPHLYERDPWEDAPSPTTDASEASHQPPVAPAGSTPTHESEEDTMSTTTISEADLATLRADAGRVQTLESERDTARTERDTEAAARLAAENRAAAIEAIADSGHAFTRLERRGLLADIPVTETGAFDANAFATTLTEAATDTRATGTGDVTGFGDTSQGGQTDLTEAELDAELAALSGRTIKEA